MSNEVETREQLILEREELRQQIATLKAREADHLKLEESLRRHQSEGRINLLLELSDAFSQALTSKQIAEVVVEHALKALGAGIGAVSLLVEGGKMLEILNLHGLPPDRVEQYRRTPLDYPGPLNDAVRTGTIVWIEAFEEYAARYPHFADLIQRNGTRSTIALPLRVNEKIIGGFSLSFPVDRPRNPAEEAFFTALAQQCAQSLERARLYEEEQQARTLAEALRDTVVALTSTLELSEVLDQILNSIDRVVQHHIADIMLVDKGVASIVRSHRYAHYGLVDSEEAMLNFSLNIADTPQLNWVFHNKQLSMIHDTRADNRWNNIYEHNLIRSSVAAPILSGDQVIGFLNINSLMPNVYTSDHGERLQVFADQAAVAIRNAQLHQRGLELAALEERQRIARDLHDAVSQTLFSANIIAESLPKLWPDQTDKALERIHQLHQLTRGAAAEMRALLMELRPSILTNSLLSDLLAQLCDAIRGRSVIPVLSDINLADQETLPSDVRIAVYRIAQESLNNTIKHARATQVSLHVQSTADIIEMRIIDNGGGFDLSDVTPGIGLHSMRERAEKVGASLRITAAKGQGTEIMVSWTAPGKDEG